MLANRGVKMTDTKLAKMIGRLLQRKEQYAKEIRTKNASMRFLDDVISALQKLNRGGQR